MPASQDDPSFSTLDERARSDDLVFRVYTEHSASPLVWTGTPATSGFFAPNGYLSISPSVYTRLSTGGQSAYSLVDGPYGRHSLVDHILGKEQQTCILVPSSIQERDSIPEDDKSCWISCTRSLTWAIWEAARRIATEECLEVHVSLITRKRQEQHTSGGESKAFAGREISVVPGRSILAGLREGRAQQLFSMNTREAYEIAARQATESEEVLYYGRIFAESIEADLVFTRDHLPLDLPPYFFASSVSHPDRSRNTRTPSPSECQSAVQSTARSPSSSPTKRSSAHSTLGGAIASSKSQVVHGLDRDDTESRGRPRHERASSSLLGRTASTTRQPSETSQTVNETWLDRLVWNPESDTFRTASRAIAQRRSDLYRTSMKSEGTRI